MKLMDMMIYDITPLQSIIKTISTSCDIFTLIVEPEKLEIRAMDRGHIQYYQANIDPDYFSPYIVNETNQFELNPTDLLEIFSRVHNNETLEIKLDETGNKFQCEIINPDTQTKKQYNITPIDSEYHTPEFPLELEELEGKFSINTKEFSQQLKDLILKRNSAKVKIIQENNKLILESVDDFNDTNKIEIPLEEAEYYQGEAIYGHELLIDAINGGTKLSKDTHVYFAEMSPITLEWKELLYTFRVVTAPRIEE